MTIAFSKSAEEHGRTNTIWGPGQQETFEDMKNRLSTPPVLACQNFELPCILTTDASKMAVAAILSQVQTGVQRPIAYASRHLNKAGQAYSATEAEIQDGSNMTGTDLYKRTHKSFPVIFEPPCNIIFGQQSISSGTCMEKIRIRTDHSDLMYLCDFA